MSALARARVPPGQCLSLHPAQLSDRHKSQNLRPARVSARYGFPSGLGLRVRRARRPGSPLRPDSRVRPARTGSWPGPDLSPARARVSEVHPAQVSSRQNSQAQLSNRHKSLSLRPARVSARPGSPPGPGLRLARRARISARHNSKTVTSH
jgi:hypothetical protein